MVQVGMRELKENIGAFVLKLKQGESIILKYRGKPLGVVRSLYKKGKMAHATELAFKKLEQQNLISSGSGRIDSGMQPVKAIGKSVSLLVIESRE
ncbi:MAG: hypothetical protein HYU97_06020 [Deltaproteobacteria bacterium]|nr:hypothetical protein [Deltaproteobacteria bacterium]